jgi:hypothetical protein
LDTPRQFVLTFGRDEGVLARHFQIAVAGDLGSFDRATTDLLPPRDIGSPK